MKTLVSAGYYLLTFSDGSSAVELAWSADDAITQVLPRLSDNGPLLPRILSIRPMNPPPPHGDRT